MDEIHWGLLITRCVHLGAGMAVVGGAAFMYFALTAETSVPPGEEERGPLRESVRIRWTRVVHICMFLLLASGSISFTFLAITPKTDPVPYHPIFGLKVLVALAMFYITCALLGRSQRLAGMRRAANGWLKGVLALAAAVLLLSALLEQVRSASEASPTTEHAYEPAPTSQA